MNEKMKLLVLIDADNVSASFAEFLFHQVTKLGDPIIRRAYGTVQTFSGGGWIGVQRKYGIVSRPQVSNLSGKNISDIALVIDAMECLYQLQFDGLCVVSSDSDYTALAAKFREAGKVVYGIGSEMTPISFRKACTKFVTLPQKNQEVKKEKSGTTPQMSQKNFRTDNPSASTIAQKREPEKTAMKCPRCGNDLVRSKTKSNHICHSCPSCGGLAAKLNTLNTQFDADSILCIKEQVRRQTDKGCVCPSCGHQMTLIRLASSKESVEVDVCGNCHMIWYDKTEYETLIPEDGVCSPVVTSGKSFRREILVQVSADLRSKRLKVNSLTALENVLKNRYHASADDCRSIIQQLKNNGDIKE